MLKKKAGKHLGFYTEFATANQEAVLMKAGISFVSIDGAKNNLETEIKGWNFDGIRQQAFRSWNKALGKITVAGGSEEEKKVFYTALYHTMIDPRNFSDVDGKYIGGDGKIHAAKSLQQTHHLQWMGCIPQPDAVANDHQSPGGE